MKNNFTMVKKIRTYGLEMAMEAMRQPFQGKSKGIGEDLKLARSLISKGTEERKFMRQIMFSIHIEASMAWWAEFDTYKVGVTRNSQSFWNSWKGVFEKEQFVLPIEDDIDGDALLYSQAMILQYINNLVDLKVPKEQLRYLIPQGIKYNAIVTITGESMLNMIRQRQNHRLKEWITFLCEVFTYLDEAEEYEYSYLLSCVLKDDSKVYKALNEKE